MSGESSSSGFERARLKLLSQPCKTIHNPDILVWISNVFTQNSGHLSGFQMAGLPDFRSHSKSRLVWISDPHCILVGRRCEWPFCQAAHGSVACKNVTFNCQKIYANK